MNSVEKATSTLALMKSFLDHTNDADKGLIQADSILTTLLSNDHFATMGTTVVAGSLWAVQEAVQDATSSIEKMHSCWKNEREANEQKMREAFSEKPGAEPVEQQCSMGCVDAYSTHLHMQEALSHLKDTQAVLESFVSIHVPTV
ncbi:MAG: hypothetical protein SH820_11390 [Xanthomonadales bacterium]|nr:hypothetical protein [Xanthomonadales bacterium]